MILDEYIKIKTHTRLKKYYENLGYDMNYEYVTILVEHLTKNSHCKILVKCDICGKEKIATYSKYLKGFDNGGYYACCPKCAQGKNKCTMIINYGVDNPSKSEEFRTKSKNTQFEKYGKLYSQTEECKNRIKETTEKTYGKSCYLQTDDCRKKMQEYLDTHKDEVSNKKKETNLIIYGTEHPSQNSEIKNKTQQTNLLLYNSKNGLDKDKYLDTIKNNFLKKYPNLDFIELDFSNRLCKIFCQKCDNLYSITFNQLHYRLFKNHDICTICTPIGSIKKISKVLEGFLEYSKTVRSLTNKNKKILFDNWNGIDYYDGDYIKDNFNLMRYSPLYPNVDHKISVSYGFLNLIDEETISNIDNLCITKKIHNQRKHSKIEIEYLKSIDKNETNTE